jgi:hypothetical protein
MSTILYRKWDIANAKHIYTDCADCSYDECWDAATKTHGVYCDSVFYPRCWNPALDPKNWQVTVPCCGPGKTFIDVVANWVAWDFGVQRVCSKSLTLESEYGYDCSDNNDLWFINVSAGSPFNMLWFDFSSGNVWIEILDTAYSGDINCRGASPCDQARYMQDDLLFVKIASGITCSSFLSGGAIFYSCDLGYTWSLDLEWGAAYD